MMCTATSVYGEGLYTIHAIAVLCGGDISAVFVGGELPHVGAVSLAVYEPERDSATVSTMTVFTHRDDQLAMKGAKKLATELKCTASVSVGIHLDDATPDGIMQLRENFEGCLKKLIQMLKEKEQTKDGA